MYYDNWDGERDNKVRLGHHARDGGNEYNSNFANIGGSSWGLPKGTGRDSGRDERDDRIYQQRSGSFNHQ